jgi:hypothetical protein
MPESSPPDTMTWSRAAPMLVVSGILDFIRICFEWLGFLAPILAGVLAVSALDSSAWTSWLPGFAKDLAGLSAAALAAAAFPVLEALGIILSMATGFFSWLAIGIWLAFSNRRIFKANAFNLLWFVAGLGVDEIPFVSGFVPGLTLTLWNMYRTQIKKEKAALRAWEAENQARLEAARDEEVAEAQAYLARQSAAEQADERAELAEAEAVQEEDAEDAYREAADDNEEIPAAWQEAA